MAWSSTALASPWASVAVQEPTEEVAPAPDPTPPPQPAARPTAPPPRVQTPPPVYRTVPPDRDYDDDDYEDYEEERAPRGDEDDDDDDDEGAEDEFFDDAFELYVAPGMNTPYGDDDDGIDYGELYDPGFQWGFGLGYFGRHDDSMFGMGVGGFFEQAFLEAEGGQTFDTFDNSILRAGLELRPGVVLGERVFLSVPLRGGYTANVTTRDDPGDEGDEIDARHGPMFGVAGQIEIAVIRGLYFGTAVGTDMHFFRSGTDQNVHTIAWRALAGWRF